MQSHSEDMMTEGTPHAGGGRQRTCEGSVLGHVVTGQSIVSWLVGMGWGQREEMQVAKRGHFKFYLPDALGNAIDTLKYPVAPSGHLWVFQ